MYKLTKFSSFIRKLIIDKNYNYSTRNRKTDILDAFTFNLFCTQKGKSKDAICGNINELNKRYNKKKEHVSRQALSARNNQLTVDFYRKTYDSINKYTDLNFYKDKYSYEVFAVDGTDSNLRQILIENNKEAEELKVTEKATKNKKKIRSDEFKLNKKGKSITALNIGIYNVTRNYPITIEMVKHKSERRAYIDFMRNKIRKENEIHVFDAGFDGINFIKKLENLKINYIVRIKKNSTFLKNEVTDHIHTTKDGIQIRTITYKINNKEYYLATNLMDKKEFTVMKLKELYHQRWSAEEFFKYVKYVFNFAYMNNKTLESIQKSIYGQLIILRIIALLAKINEKKKNLSTNTKTINKKLLADGLFNGFLYLLVNGKLKRKQIDEFNKNYVIVITTNKGKNVPRTCARPFMKWYIKQHFKKYTKGTIDDAS